MSSKADHKAKAEHTQRLADSLVSPYEDWIVTTFFYVAVQYVEAYFAANQPPIHSPDHGERDTEIRKSPFLRLLWRDYRELKNQSRNARYEAHIPFAQRDVDAARIRLETIKKAILPKLK